MNSLQIVSSPTARVFAPGVVDPATDNLLAGLPGEVAFGTDLYGLASSTMEAYRATALAVLWADAVVVPRGWQLNEDVAATVVHARSLELPVFVATGRGLRLLPASA